jgi:hypothetical protein
MARFSSIALSLLRFATGLMLALFHGLGKVNGALGFSSVIKSGVLFKVLQILVFQSPSFLLHFQL